MFSGGVGHFIYENEIKDVFSYGDYGPYFAQCIKNRSVALKKHRILKPDHTLRATVIGAGVYSMKLSGSTIYVKGKTFFLYAIYRWLKLFWKRMMMCRALGKNS